MSDFPRTIDEITPEWLTGVLRDAGVIDGTSVSSIKTRNVGDGQGILSDVFKLNLRYDNPESGVPASVIAKSALQNEIRSPGSPNLPDFARVYEREAMFYRHLSADCGLRSPKHYYSEYELDTADVLYILEDVGHLRSVDQSENCTLDDARAALISVAKMHAQWWQSDYLSEQAWLRHHGTSGAPDGVVRRFTQHFEQFFEVAGEFAPAGLEAIARKLLPKVLDVSDLLVKPPVTLAHGDFRSANFFFDDSQPIDQRLVAFDWQMVGQVKSSDDIAQFMYTSFDIETRRSLEQRLLSEYFDALDDGGVENYSRDQLNDEVRIALLLHMTKRMVATAMTTKTIQASEEGRARVRAMVEGLQMVVDWNCDEVIPK